MLDFWAAGIAPELSQGDLLSGVWVGSSVSPRKALQAGQTLKGGTATWVEGGWKPAADGAGNFLARGRDVESIVISQSCELDKKGSSAPVLIAPVFQLRVVQEEHRDRIRSGSRYAFLYLPAVEGLFEESYADLRMLNYVQRKLIDEGERRLSVTQKGEARLAAQVVAFLTRIDVSKLTAA